MWWILPYTLSLAYWIPWMSNRVWFIQTENGRYAEIVKISLKSQSLAIIQAYCLMKLVKHVGLQSNNAPNGIPILVSYCTSSVLPPFLLEWNMGRCCFWLHRTLKRVKRLFCSTPANKLMKPGCWLPFSLCVPIQLAVGPQSLERHRCNTSMIIIGAIIRKLPIALSGWILLLSLRGKRCKVKHQSLSWSQQ